MTALLFILAVPTEAVARQDAGALVLAVGGGGAGFAGDGGPASSARLNKPYGAAVAPDGTLYIADTANHRVRAVTPDGVINTVAGDGTPDGESGPVPAGTKGTAISLALPSELAVGTDGTLFIADGPAFRVYRMVPDGAISLHLDATIGQGTLERPLRFPRGLAVSADGTLYVSDRENDRVVAITAGGAVSVVAEVFAPNGLAVDGQGDLWIAAQDLYRMRGGTVSPILDPQADRWAVGIDTEQPPDDVLGNVRSVAARASDVYVVDDVRHTVRGLSADGTVFTAVDLDTVNFGSGPFDLAAGTAADSRLYLIEMVGSRVLVMEKSRPSPPVTPQRDSVWPWLSGAGVALAAAVAVVLVARRRSPELTK